MKTKKIIGICMIVIVFLGLIAWSSNNYLKYSALQNSANENSCVEHEKTINRLQSELEQANNSAQGEENNEKAIVAEQAEFFLKTFYESSNQKESVQSLMTDEAFKKLYQNVDQNGDGIGTNENYQATITNQTIYYTKTDNVTADVMILANLNVRTLGGNTTSNLLFHATMTWQNETWLVSEIIQNSTIKFN